ncbi:MAG: hypothetical protein H0Z38_05860 [Firmicutes bacterium]|nr:hypothetical protein [Bacillota bacterium]
MPDLYLLFSHELTDQQKRDAYEVLGVREIYYLPENLQILWSQIPPEIPEVAGHIQPIKRWLENRVKQGDYLLVQGDFGATYLMVKWAFSRNCRPIYATSQRKIIKEAYNNEEVITHRLFEHVRFRLYEKG